MKSNEFWALYNVNNLWCVEKTKRACREAAERETASEWKECRCFFDIKRVRVELVDT